MQRQLSIKMNTIKSKCLGGAITLYIPSVEKVANAISVIPKDETKTIQEVRRFSDVNLTTCPSLLSWEANIS